MKLLFKKFSLLTALILTFVLVFVSPEISIASESEAIFAGGCFWCLEHDLEGLEGVASVQSGYSGGDLEKPTYKNHRSHQEVVLVKFDPEKISYKDLLRSYWLNIDPFDGEGQFCDRGDSYRPLIFTNDEMQASIARNSLEHIANDLQVSKDKIKVDIKDAGRFWIAEDYHQNFAEKNALKYNFYRYSCGRDSRLKEVWGRLEIGNENFNN